MEKIIFSYVPQKPVKLPNAEAFVFAALVSLDKPSTAMQILTELHKADTSIKNSSVYLYLDRLVERGLVSKTKDSKEFHGETLTRLIFSLTTNGEKVYELRQKQPAQRGRAATARASPFRALATAD